MEPYTIYAFVERYGRNEIFSKWGEGESDLVI